MKRLHLLILVSAWLQACTSLVVTGQVLFGKHVDISDIKTEGILALNDELRDYVASKVDGDPQARSRLRKLISGMIDDGLLTLEYDANRTYTAIETFQMVDIPPSFRAGGDMILLNNHINVVVKGVRSDINHTREYVVDFNTAEYNGNYDTRTVTDNYAVALYYSNLAVEFMQSGDSRKAFRYLKKGIETDPQVAGLWVTLGVLYSRDRKYNMAKQAYRQALSVQPSDKSALVNLAGALQYRGYGCQLH